MRKKVVSAFAVHTLDRLRSRGVDLVHILGVRANEQYSIERR